MTGRFQSRSLTNMIVHFMIELEKERPSGKTFDLDRRFEIGHKESLPKKEDLKTEELPVFERFTTAGAISIYHWTKDLSRLIPPSKVLNLRVVTSSLEDDDHPKVVLQWTSPGDDMDVGKASKIELRASTKFHDLLPKNFDKAFSFENLPEPLPPREVQVINVTLPKHFVQDQISKQAERELMVAEVYFALRAHDANGNVAKVSNIAVAHVSKAWDEIPNAKDEPTAAPPTEKPTLYIEKKTPSTAKRRGHVAPNPGVKTAPKKRVGKTRKVQIKTTSERRDVDTTLKTETKSKGPRRSLVAEKRKGKRLDDKAMKPKSAGLKVRETSTEKDESQGHSGSLIAGVILAIGVVIIAIGAIYYVVVKAKKKKAKKQISAHSKKVQAPVEQAVQF